MTKHSFLKSAGLALTLAAGAVVPTLGCTSNRADTAPTSGGGLTQHGQIETGSGTNTTTNNGGSTPMNRGTGMNDGAGSGAGTGTGGMSGGMSGGGGGR